MFDNETALIFVTLVAGTLTIAFGRQHPRPLHWVVLTGAFAVAGVIAYVEALPIGAWLALAFVVLVMAPMWTLVFARRALAAHRLRLAAVLARVAYVLHPSKAARTWMRTIAATRLMAAGKHDEAVALLEPDRAADPAGTAIELARLRCDWPQVLALFDAAGPDPLANVQGALYLRALGELGQLDRMVALHAEAEQRWAAKREQLATARVFVAAFLGQPALVDALFAAPPLVQLGAANKQLWHATARMAAGELDATAPVWSELASSPETRISTTAKQRRAHPVVRADSVGEHARAAIDTIAAHTRDAAIYAPATTIRPIACWVIAGVTVVAHVVAVAWPASYELGVYWTPAVVDQGEWWRLFTAMFLHAGWMHLAMNMLGLVVLGPFVEKFLGRVRFVIVYVLGGIGCFAVIAARDSLGWHDPSAALGASGAVMALIGASTAIYVRGRLARSPIATAQLQRMLRLVALQAAFDILVPHVSMTGHLGGLAIGFVVGFAIAPRKR